MSFARCKPSTTAPPTSKTRTPAASKTRPGKQTRQGGPRVRRVPRRERLGHTRQRCRVGEIISTSFVESAVNQIISKRMVKRQQMRWSPRGAPTAPDPPPGTQRHHRLRLPALVPRLHPVCFREAPGFQRDPAGWWGRRILPGWRGLDGQGRRRLGWFRPAGVRRCPGRRPARGGRRCPVRSVPASRPRTGG